MAKSKNLQHFRKAFFQPRVYVFILTGIAVIFLTFLTDDNALEIAISGMASVFIGIGVNNLTSIEIHSEDDVKLKIKIGHAIKIMEITRARISRLRTLTVSTSDVRINDELAELDQFIDISIDLIKDNASIS